MTRLLPHTTLTFGTLIISFSSWRRRAELSGRLSERKLRDAEYGKAKALFQSVVQEVRYVLPPGWSPTALPPPTEVRESFGSFTLRWRRDCDTLVAERELVMNTPRIEPAEYPAFRRFAEAVDTADRQTVEIREGSR